MDKTVCLLFVLLFVCLCVVVCLFVCLFVCFLFVCCCCCFFWGVVTHREHSVFINTEIKANGQKLEVATSLKYLGSVTIDEGSKPEIPSRIAQTTAALTMIHQG